MVPQRDGVVTQGVESGDHRMRAPAPGIGGIVGNRAALQEVAIVKEQAILRLAPRLGDLLRHRAQSEVQVRPIRAIVVGHQAGMEIAGGDQPQSRQRAMQRGGARRASGLARTTFRGGGIRRTDDCCSRNVIHHTSSDPLRTYSPGKLEPQFTPLTRAFYRWGCVNVVANCRYSRGGCAIAACCRLKPAGKRQRLDRSQNSDENDGRPCASRKQ